MVRKPEPPVPAAARLKVTLGVRLVTVGGVRGRDAGAGGTSSGGGRPDGTGPERADAGGAGKPDRVLGGAGIAVRAGRDAADGRDGAAPVRTCACDLSRRAGLGRDRAGGGSYRARTAGRVACPRGWRRLGLPVSRGKGRRRAQTAASGSAGRGSSRRGGSRSALRFPWSRQEATLWSGNCWSARSGTRCWASRRRRRECRRLLCAGDWTVPWPISVTAGTAAVGDPAPADLGRPRARSDRRRLQAAGRVAGGDLYADHADADQA